MQSAPKTRLLIVEDEEPILKGLCDVFTFNGYEVDFAADGKSGLAKALSNNYHLLILDIMLPFIDGLTICNEVRKKDRFQPILLLTAKGDEEDIIKGLKQGADDYVTKPFSIKELIARVEAVLRRSQKLISEKDKIHWNDFIIDPQNLTLEKNGETQELTRKEVDILRYLLKHSTRPVSRDELLKEVWGYNGTHIDTRTVDIHMVKLRKKIETDPQNPEQLVTIRNQGYKLIVA